VKLPIVVLALLIAFGIGLWCGYQKWHKPNETTMMLGITSKMIPHMYPGDILHFSTAVKFDAGDNLCVESDPEITNCTVKKEVGDTKLRYYAYSCKNPDDCPDPDVGGGSDVGPPVTGTTSSGVMTALTKLPRVPPIKVICQDNHMSAVKTANSIVSKGQKIFWYPDGSVGSSWAAGPDLSALCDEGLKQYDDTNYTRGCTVSKSAPPTTSYTITTQACTTAGTDTITVNP
jgi:hypothetical protein